MSRFNTSTIPKTRTVSLAGGKAFKMDAETELVHAVVTTFLDNKFYEGSEERMERLRDLVSRVSPEFVANLAVITRKEFHLRSVSHLLVGELAKIHTGDDLVKRVIVAVAERPDDLSEIAAYVGLPMPHQVKRGIRNAILKFDRYQLAKYKMEGKEFSLVDLFNLTHPKAQHATKEQKKAWKDLIAGKLKSEDTWETEISNTEGEEEKTGAWESLVLEGKIGYMALLRNLNNLVKSGVSDKTIKLACKILTDKNRVKTSKQIPFRFLTAYNNVKGNRVLLDAVSEAMDISVENVPSFKGKSLIAVDKSGSMNGTPIERAAIFAATLMKTNKGAEVIFFADKHKVFDKGSRVPVVDLANEIKNDGFGGGTDLSQVFKYAGGKVYDRIFILSDNESWKDSVLGNGPQSSLNTYKQAAGADPYVYTFDLQGYGTTDLKGGKVFKLAGFSDRVLDFVKLMEDGGSLVEYVRNYQLDF